VLTLGAILFRADPAAVPLGVVNGDQGITSPLTGSISLGQLIVEELAASDSLDSVELPRDAIEGRLRDGTAQAVIVFPEDFTVGFVQSRQAVLDLRLEGSNPTRSLAITAQVAQAATRALASLAGAGLGAGATAAGDAPKPVTVETTYLYGGQEFDAVDYIAPIYIALLGMFFVFLLACVAFLRERSQGTMERLAATPATRAEIVVGYLSGLGLFGLIQVAVILFYTIWVLDIHYLGSLGLLFLVIALLGIVGISMGILASAFARNEFQVIQFIPLAIFPQVLLGGTFWAVAELPAYLRPFAYLMPLYYGNTAMRDVMIKGWGQAEIWPNLAVLVGFAAVFIVLSAAMMRREVA
ncbi:MAG: ABC transporter permease, partial [Anaerolineae bacterium]|nr:ABC transporter permease [Anaerolineae bacterium]